MKKLIVSLLVALTMLGQSTAARAGDYPDVFIVFDTSQSMRGERLSAAKEATTAFVAGLPAEVEVGLLTFSSSTRLVVPLTLDHARISTAISTLVARGDTALYDGIDRAAQAVQSSVSAHIVVLSDGEDNTSTLTLSRLLTRLDAGRAIVDVVALKPSASQLSVLRKITAVNQGAVVTAASANKLLKAFSQVVVTPTATPTQSPKPTHGSTVSPTSSTSVGDLNQSFAGRLGAFVAIALGGLLVASIGAVWRFFRIRKLRLRLDQYTDFSIVPAELASDQKPTSLLDNFDLRERLPKTASRLDNSALGIPLNIWVLMMAITWFGAVAIFRNSTGSTLLAFIVSTLIVTQGGRQFLQWRFNRRLREFEEDLPATLAVLASSLRAGLSFAQALDTAIADGKGEISLQFRQALQEVQVGSALEDALMRTAERMKSEDLKWAVTGLTIQREVGGSLSRILDTSAKTIRERAELRREVRTLSAEGRLSAMVLAGLPVLIFLFLMVTRPQYVSVFWTEPIGNIMLILMLVLFGAGWMWVSKLVKVRV